MMKSVQKWCEQNNWTELRQLPNGIWVAFPPGGVMETPLPIKAGMSDRLNNHLQDLLNILVLTMAVAVISAIALLISPLFLASIIGRYQRNKSRS